MRAASAKPSVDAGAVEEARHRLQSAKLAAEPRGGHGPRIAAKTSTSRRANTATIAAAARRPYSKAYEMPSPISGSQPAASPTSSASGEAIAALGWYQRIGNASSRGDPAPSSRVRSRTQVRQRNRPAAIEGVGAEVHVQSPADPARELPEIPLEPARHGAEVEDVSRAVDVAERIRRQIAHHGAPDRSRRRREQPTADDAARAVGADHDAWANLSPIGEDPQRPALALDVDDLLVFLDRHASLLHPRGEQRIELASPHDRAQIARAMVNLALEECAPWRGRPGRAARRARRRARAGTRACAGSGRRRTPCVADGAASRALTSRRATSGANATR